MLLHSPVSVDVMQLRTISTVAYEHDGQLDLEAKSETKHQTHAQRLQHLEGSSDECTIFGSAVFKPSSVGEVVMAICVQVVVNR